MECECVYCKVLLIYHRFFIKSQWWSLTNVPFNALYINAACINIFLSILQKHPNTPLSTGLHIRCSYATLKDFTVMAWTSCLTRTIGFCSGFMCSSILDIRTESISAVGNVHAKVKLQLKVLPNLIHIPIALALLVYVKKIKPRSIMSHFFTCCIEQPTNYGWGTYRDTKKERLTILL